MIENTFRFMGENMRIDILNKAIFVIDYEQEELREVESKGEFDTYIKGLINNINENETTRLFKIRRETTEVVNCVENIAKNSDNIDEINKYCKNIANKLLNEEIKVQKQIEQLRTSIKKGSLLEVLLHDIENDIYSFLIAKVEHKSFFDDVKFERRTGYSTEDNKLWKSCLFKFEDIGQEIQKDIIRNKDRNGKSDKTNNTRKRSTRTKRNYRKNKANKQRKKIKILYFDNGMPAKRK